MEQLINILLISVIIGMVTNAINIITKPGMIFGFIQDWFHLKVKEMEQVNIKIVNELILEQNSQSFINYKRDELQDKIDLFKFRLKPLFLCPTCMSSVWGTIVFCVINLTFNLFAYDYKLFGIWVLTIIVSSFSSYLFSKLNDFE